MTLLVAVLLFVGRTSERVNRYDVLERNVVVSEDGRETLRQWIVWDFDHGDGVHRCQWWAPDRGEEVQRTADGWRVTVDGRRIVARWYRETRTRHDPEVDDRSVWTVENRRKPR